MSKSRIAAIVFCAIAGAFGTYVTVKNMQQFGKLSGHTTAAKDRPAALVRSLRPNYPYSVIAGGVFSQRELSYAGNKDPVVRAHYADFNVKQAKLVQLTEDRFQYVSYRIKNQVYWTRKKLRIPKGELLWSDGLSYARARCGNRLSSDPVQPVSPKDPSEALLSMPPVQPDMLPKLSFVEAPKLADVAAEDVLPNDNSRTAAPPFSGPTQTGAGQPLDSGPVAVAVSPAFLGPGAPLGGIASPGTGNLGSGGGSIGNSGGNSGGTTGTVSSPLPTTPVNTAPPPSVSPVPEPGSALYLFFFTLVVSLWAIWRLTPGEEAEKVDGEK
jgi:hypothetical protein